MTIDWLLGDFPLASRRLDVKVMGVVFSMERWGMLRRQLTTCRPRPNRQWSIFLLLAAWMASSSVEAATRGQAGGAGQNRKNQQRGSSRARGEKAQADKSIQPAYYRGSLNDGESNHRQAVNKQMRQRWAVDLGAPIVAMPALTRDESGEPVVVVGDHAGRLVAVRPTGPQAGSIVRSWSLGGQVWSGGAVDDQGMVYVGADDDTLYAVDPKASNFRWTLRLGSCESPRAPGPEGSRCDLDGGPTIGPSGDIYVGGEGVFRVDPGGNVVWRWPSSPGPHEHVSSAPLVLPDGRVYFGTQAGRVVALDDDGKTRWAYEVESDVDGAVVATRSGFICAGADDGKVYCLDDHGRVRWSFRGQRDFRGPLGHVVAGGSEWILAASYDGSVYALSGHGILRWHVRTQGAFHAMPVVDNGHHVYLGGRDGLFYVIDGRRGKIRSRYRVGVQVDAPALVLDDGTIVVGADDGVLRALR